MSILRSKKIALVSHCILNANSKVQGLATYSGIIHFVVNQLSAREYGLIQLPCPEFTLLGLKRLSQTLEQYQTPFYREHCKVLAKDIIAQVIEYKENGYRVDLAIGIDGSPSCGVKKTCSGDGGGCFSRQEPQEKPFITIDGQGVFTGCLKTAMEENGICIDWFGVDEVCPSSSEIDLQSLLNNI